MNEAQRWIEALDLTKHPEGGYYRETHRGGPAIRACCLPEGFRGERAASTSIYYLLPGGEISTFHRIRSDELWHYYAGSSLTVHVLFPESGRHRRLRLGLDPARNQEPQAVVPAGAWFGALVDDPASYSLMGCTVSPGFDFRDFEIARRESLLREFPEHRAVIEALTR
jgi:predicted cupin superfamily sugar epimerase